VLKGDYTGDVLEDVETTERKTVDKKKEA